jgi:hypothetical protein
MRSSRDVAQCSLVGVVSEMCTASFIRAVNRFDRPSLHSSPVTIFPGHRYSTFLGSPLIYTYENVGRWDLSVVSRYFEYKQNSSTPREANKYHIYDILRDIVGRSKWNNFFGGGGDFTFIDVTIRLRRVWKWTNTNSVLLEKPVVAHLVSKLPTFYGTRKLITMFVRAL